MPSSIPPDLAPELAASIATVTHAPRLLVASDFDGVLAPFVRDPLDARAQAGTLDSLGELAAAPSTWAAVVSGRDLATLASLTGLDESGAPITLIGSHGAETNRTASDVVTEQARARLAELRSRVEAEVERQDPRIRLEHKPTAIVLHVRDLPPEAATAATHIAETAAQAEGVSLLSGKGVHELTVVRADKGTALRSLATELDVDTIVYLGDDVTDEHAFAVLGPHDLGIKVGDGETAATVRISGCADVPAVLASLAASRQRTPR